MDFELNEDQQLLMTAFEALLDPHRAAPHGQHGYTAYSAGLQAELHAGGFLEICAQPGFGMLEAALMIEAAAACPVSVELAASALVLPLLPGLSGPLAIARGLGKPVRFLPRAAAVCLIDEAGVVAGRVSPDMLRPVESTSAYPLAVLERLPTDARRMNGAEAEALRTRALIGMAAEAAGLMRGALDHTVRWVKERQQFGRPIGDFQAVQHRLAECAQMVRAARWLALRAAHSGTAHDARLALLHAQAAIPRLVTDCHQFSGAMGLTLEFPLHLWTYRLKVLQGEAGGRGAQGRALANAVWPQAA